MEFRPEAVHNRNDGHRNASSDQAVLDSRRSRFVSQECSWRLPHANLIGRQTLNDG